MAKILVTGGAGYIGSHITKNLLKQGYEVLVFDNLSKGYLEPIEILQKKFENLEFIKGDLSDKELLKKIFSENEISCVIHLAAHIDVNESMANPELYHQENYLNSINLIDAMTEAGVNKLIFSSTAAVYGNPEYSPIDENHPTNPTSSYGKTKLDFEKYLKGVENLDYIIFRFFNVGGSDPEGLIGKSHLKSQDLIESILKVALGKKEKFQIFGQDFTTPDGTAIRDFVHVEDIAQAHLKAIEKLSQQKGEIFNLASEKGFSVKEILDKAIMVIGKDIPNETIEKREGDISVSVASAEKAKTLLNWEPQYSNLEKIIQTDCNWRKTHPMGYNFNKFPRTY